MQKTVLVNAFILLLLLLVVFAACDALKKNDSTITIDSTNLIIDSVLGQTPVSETTGSYAPKDDGKGNYQYIQSYLVEGVPDPTPLQTISVSCAIKIELSQAEIDEKNQMKADWEASEFKSDSIWYATKHDSASIAEREEIETTIADDDMWYRYIDGTAQEKLFFLDSLKIPTVTARENYLKLVGKTGKVWLVNTRSMIEPGRTIILFNKDKEPILLDRLDMNVILILDYFQSQ